MANNSSKCHTHHCNRMGPDLVGEAGIDGSLSGNVAGADLLNDRAGNYIIDIFLANGRLIDQSLERKALQIDAELVGVDGRGHGKRQADAIHHHHGFGRILVGGGCDIGGTEGSEGGGGTWCQGLGGSARCDSRYGWTGGCPKSY